MSEPQEPAAEPAIAKSTVTHKLAFVGKNPELALLPFQMLMDGFHKQQLLRINRYKGISHGNQQPAHAI